jgi:hypothetical protein
MAGRIEFKSAGATRKPTTRVHHFESSEEAYDATQCNPEVMDGDVLVIWPAGIVGIADTWPFSVTPDHGHLHGTKDEPEVYAALRDLEQGYFDRFEAGVRLAREIIEETGFLNMVGPLPRWR